MTRALRRASIQAGDDGQRLSLQLVRTDRRGDGPEYHWIEPDGSLLVDCHGRTVARAVEALVLSYALPTWQLRMGR